MNLDYLNLRNAPTMPTKATPLTDALAMLGALTHDELTDLIDALDDDDHVAGVYLRRKGNPPIPPLTIWAQVARLSTADRAIIRAAAQLLRATLAPNRRTDANGQTLACGTIEAKFITRPRVNWETKEVEILPHGPYLYYRTWATGANHNRRGRRLTNQYIGRKELAILYAATEPDSPERRALEARIIDAYHAGTLDDLERELTN
jgi:hypothetical protein